jgi:hypothetical protein
VLLFMITRRAGTGSRSLVLGSRVSVAISFEYYIRLGVVQCGQNARLHSRRESNSSLESRRREHLQRDDRLQSICENWDCLATFRGLPTDGRDIWRA